jgi:hypothetical protein
MAYRAPELYDVKTDTTLDEKVDIWVCGFVSLLSSYWMFFLVSWVHAVRHGIFPFSFREHPNNGAGWKYCHGCLERAI